MTLQELFETLGAAIFDGVDPNTEIVLQDEYGHYNSIQISAVWIDKGNLSQKIHLDAGKATSSGQKVLWEQKVDQLT